MRDALATPRGIQSGAQRRARVRRDVFCSAEEPSSLRHTAADNCRRQKRQPNESPTNPQQ
eukprot:7068559-Pyramimonas_sp.AAC.1